MTNESKLRQIIRDVLIEHDMSLDTLIKSKVSGSNACDDCKGTGKYIPAFGAVRDCDTCNGSGQKKSITAQPISQPQEPRAQPGMLMNNPIIISHDDGNVDIYAYVMEFSSVVRSGAEISKFYSKLQDAIETAKIGMQGMVTKNGKVLLRQLIKTYHSSHVYDPQYTINGSQTFFSADKI